MSLLVTFDPNGLVRVDFYRMREELLRDGRGFDSTNLRSIPYEQLFMCATGNAGRARCSLDLVRAEKLARRRRFEEMSPDQIHLARRYIQSEGMFADVHAERTLRTCPPWDQLSVVQKIWHKLTCLYNHVDAPRERLIAAKGLFVRAGRSAQLPLNIAEQYGDRMNKLLTRPPPAAHDFSLEVAGYAEDILQRMAGKERILCTRVLLRDYHCTQDCFQPASNHDA